MEYLILALGVLCLALALWITAFKKHPKNVWHHATEEPEFEEMLIVYLDKDGFIDIFNWTELKELCGDSWDNYVSYNDLVMWVYVDDFMSPNIRKQYINNE